MQIPHTHTPSPAGGTSAECCTELECGSGLKNRFFEGKRLTPDMFRVEQRYLVERRRLINRAIHGWGVVYGYAIGVDKSGRKAGARVLRIGQGLALDACGRELVETGARPITTDDVIVLDDQGARGDAKKIFTAAAYESRSSDSPLCWILRVHYAEQLTDPVTVADPCRCDRHEWDHACETVRYTLQRVPCDDCCAEDPCGLNCTCGSGPCCEDRERYDDGRDPKRQDAGPEWQGDEAKRKAEEAKRQAEDKRRGAAWTFTRGGCRCLCDHLTGLEPGEECRERLCEIEEPCARVRVDLAHGVPLACVRIGRGECDDWTFGDWIDACGPRRLVKRNDLLFDLIRGCDLTRLASIGWGPWHRVEQPIPFDTFAESFGPAGHQLPEYVTKDFWVRFTRPVRRETVRPDCFVFTVMAVEREGRWWDTQRVPITRLEYIPPEPGDPPNTVRGARFVIEGGWVEDGLRGRGSWFHDQTWVEIEVRGDFIVDCNGQTVDANAIGLSRYRFGNGTPGGTFLSTFRVAPIDVPVRSYPTDKTERKGASS